MVRRFAGNLLAYAGLFIGTIPLLYVLFHAAISCLIVQIADPGFLFIGSLEIVVLLFAPILGCWYGAKRLCGDSVAIPASHGRVALGLTPLVGFAFLMVSGILDLRLAFP